MRRQRLAWVSLMAQGVAQFSRACRIQSAAQAHTDLREALGPVPSSLHAFHSQGICAVCASHSTGLAGPEGVLTVSSLASTLVISGSGQSVQ